MNCIFSVLFSVRMQMYGVNWIVLKSSKFVFGGQCGYFFPFYVIIKLTFHAIDRHLVSRIIGISATQRERKKNYTLKEGKLELVYCSLSPLHAIYDNKVQIFIQYYWNNSNKDKKKNECSEKNEVFWKIFESIFQLHISERKSIHLMQIVDRSNPVTETQL